MPQKDAVALIPQVLSIVRLSARGSFPLKKVVRSHLGEPSHLRWCVDDEITIAPCTSSAPKAIPVARRLTPPGSLVDLAPSGTPPDRLALVQRPGRVAVKRFELDTEPASHAHLIDVETRTLLRRIMCTNPAPKQVLAVTMARVTGQRLQASLRRALAKDDSLEGWTARSILGWSTSTDPALRRQLLRARLDEQQEDGSWSHEVNRTARLLCELATLGEAGHPAASRGLSWLLSRPESPHNPGMVFGHDELVQQQMDIVARRSTGERARFRERRAREMRETSAFSALYAKPCGPRIMWPNAHVLEAALALGKESHPRIARMLDTLATQDWCECAYQHGTSGWKRTRPMTHDELAGFEAGCMTEYRTGGIRDPETLYRMDLSWSLGQPLLRIHQETDGATTRYALSRYDHLQGCELVTTRALVHVADPRLRRLAQAHLWRVAGRQDPNSGAFGPSGISGYFYTALSVLDTVSRYDSAVALAIMSRALSGIVAQQRDDGLWGEGEWTMPLTLVVARTLARLAPYLPNGFIY